MGLAVPPSVLRPAQPAAWRPADAPAEAAPAEEAAVRELLAVLRQRQAVLERKQALADAVKLALESV